MGGILGVIVALLKAAFPLPDFRDKEDLADWLSNLCDPVAELIVGLLDQLVQNGSASIESPDGGYVTLVRNTDGTLTVSEGGVDRLVAAALHGDGGDRPKAWGDGTILKMLIELFIKFAPIIIPLILEPEPEPEPEPPVV